MVIHFVIRGLLRPPTNIGVLAMTIKSKGEFKNLNGVCIEALQPHDVL